MKSEFNELKKAAKNTLITFLDNNKKILLSIPEHRTTILSSLDMLDYLFNLEFQEMECYSSELRNGENDRLIPGFMVRISFLCNFLVMMNSTLEKQYKRTSDFLQKEFNFKHKIPKELQIDRRWKEISKFKIWRDKVFAHTSYSNPKSPNYEKDSLDKTDNFTLQMNSVFLGFGNSLRYGENSFFIPGAVISYPELQETIDDLPEINVFDSYEEILYHMKCWVDLNKDLIDKFSKRKDKLNSKNFSEVV